MMKGGKMFELNGEYENRKGKYTVLSIDGPIMNVRYEDGSHADLRMNIQERIWENIVTEREIVSSKSAARKKRKSPGALATTNHYIKVVNITPGEDLIFPGWVERVVMVTNEAQKIKRGDRLIYYAMEAEVFFAVATVTGESFSADPKKYTYTVDLSKAQFFPIDIDTETGTLENGLPLDSIELESSPNFPEKDTDPEAFCSINEDDFELLSEALIELSEEDLDDDIIDEDDLDEEEDED